MKGFLFRLFVCLLSLTTLAAAKQKKSKPPETLDFIYATTNGVEYKLEAAASIYIAPWKEGSFYLMRFPNGEYREFQNVDHPAKKEIQRLWSPHGWYGGIREKEGLIWIQSGKNVLGGAIQFLFKNGRLVQFEQNGKKPRPIPYDQPRVRTDGGVPHPPKATAEEITREMNKKWKKSGRLRWPFKNPNDSGFFFAVLALLSTMLFFLKPIFGNVRIPMPKFSKCKDCCLVLSDVQIVGGLCFMAATTALMLTVSRGSMLGLACGLVPVIAINFKKVVRSKAVWILTGIVFITAVAWFATHVNQFTRGFRKDSKWSNESRVEKLVATPKMVAEAPNGWECMRVDKEHMAGRAYMDWYDDLSVISLPFSLVSDHMSFLVGYSMVWRFVYVFVWLGIIALLTHAVVRTKRAAIAVALGMFLAIAVAGWFNKVLVHYLWGVPLIALGLFIAGRPWRVWRLRAMGLLIGSVALSASVVLAGIYLLGNFMSPKRGYPIYVADGQVLVKDKSPDIWIVDDDYVLGEALSCRDIRRYLQGHPSAPPIGYVRSVEDLPKGEIRRLVLAGKAGKQWLDWLFARLIAGEHVAIPEELVFISPTFMPSDLVEEIVQKSKVRYIVGEFVTRYYDYEEIPEGLEMIVVPGMEIYIKNWMRFAVE